MRPALFATLAAMGGDHADRLRQSRGPHARPSREPLRRACASLGTRRGSRTDRVAARHGIARAWTCIGCGGDRVGCRGFQRLTRCAAARRLERAPDSGLDVLRCCDDRRDFASLAVALLPAYSVWRSDLRTQLLVRERGNCNAAVGCKCSSWSAKSLPRCCLPVAPAC